MLKDLNCNFWLLPGMAVGLCNYNTAYFQHFSQDFRFWIRLKETTGFLWVPKFRVIIISLQSLQGTHIFQDKYKPNTMQADLSHGPILDQVIPVIMEE